MNAPPKKHRPAAQWPIVVGGGALLLLLAGMFYWIPVSTPDFPSRSELDWDLLRYRGADEGTYTYYNFVQARRQQCPGCYPAHLDFSEVAAFQVNPQEIEAAFGWQLQPGYNDIVLTVRFTEPVALPKQLTVEHELIHKEPPIYQYKDKFKRYFGTQVDAKTIMLEIIYDERTEPTFSKHVLSQAVTNVLPPSIREAFQAASGYNQIKIHTTPNFRNYPTLLLELIANTNHTNDSREEYRRFIFPNAADAKHFHHTYKTQQQLPFGKTKYWVRDTSAHERTIFTEPK